MVCSLQYCSHLAFQIQFEAPWDQNHSLDNIGYKHRWILVTSDALSSSPTLKWDVLVNIHQTDSFVDCSSYPHDKNIANCRTPAIPLTHYPNKCSPGRSCLTGQKVAHCNTHSIYNCFLKGVNWHPKVSNKLPWDWSWSTNAEESTCIAFKYLSHLTWNIFTIDMGYLCRSPTGLSLPTGTKKNSLEGFLSCKLDLTCLVYMQIPTLQEPEFGLINPIPNDI